MIDEHQLPARTLETREEAFTKRYRQLLGWALRLTNQHRAHAEDLVQDAFIQFTRARTSLEEIENLDGYLRRMLRNMNLSRLSRSAEQILERTVSIAEQELLELATDTTEIQRRLQTQQELHRICEYACKRKESSRAGSVLILRFFFEYSPTEIAQVLCCSRHCIDQWQRLARRELKLYLENPTRLKFVNGETPKSPPSIRLSDPRQSLAEELRRIVFSRCNSECVDRSELIEIYRSASEETLSTETLAHIVSCRHCLDEVNQILDLPSLATRYEAELNDSGPTPPSSAGGGSSDGPTDFSSRFTKRLIEVINHEPKELHISVNSTPIGSLTVSDANELLLNLGDDDPIEFIEIFSEDNVRLLFFTVVDSSNDESEQWAQIELSDHRTLTANLDNVNGEQRLRVSYFHELLEAQPDILPDVSTWSKLSKRIRRWRASSNKSGRWLKPEFATAIIVAILIFVGWLVWPTNDGKKIFERAREYEAKSLAASDVIHQTFVLVEREANGPVISQRRIESWQDNSAHRRARLVYDENNSLITGEWDQPDGSRAIFNHGAGLVRDQQDKSLDANPWLFDLNASEFKTLLETNSNVRVIESDTNYVVEVNGANTQQMFGGSQLITATLTLSKPSLSIVKLVIRLQQAGKLRELEYTETFSEKVRPGDVPPGIFNPDELRSKVNTTPKEISSKSGNSISPSGRLQPVIASAELEVEVEHLLYLAKGDRNEQISLARANDGTLRVEGVVDNAERKGELLAALSSLRGNPLVAINLKTATEAAQTKLHSATERTIIRATEDTPDLIPMDREVREYFTKVKHLQADREIDDAVRSFSSGLVNRAYRQLFHAIELDRLLNRFSEVQIESMTPDARSKWLGLLHDHANALQRESAALTSNLELVQPGNKDTSFKQESAIVNYAQLRLAVERIHKMALLTNDAIGAAFTTSAHGTATGIKSIEFRRSLVLTNQLAGQLTHYQN
jgi:RNA polymerase sigma factor (sigma-70 family)